MDSEFLSDSLSSNEGSGSAKTSPFSYTQIFEQQFPYYLSIGMNEEQFWDKDCNLVKAYRKADEMKLERDNFTAWLQGKYFYDALCLVSPVLHAFAKRGTKPSPYLEEAYPVTKSSIEDTKERKEKAAYRKNRTFMEAYMVRNNKSFEQRG